MRRDLDDLHAVKPEHIAIHNALVNWRMYIIPKKSSYIHPMWHKTQSRGHYSDEGSSRDVDRGSGSQMEGALSQLPFKHMVALKWAYLWSTGYGPYRPCKVERVCRFLAVNRSSLLNLIHDGRTMLNNRQSR